MPNVTITLDIEPFPVPNSVTAVNEAEKPLPGRAPDLGHKRRIQKAMNYSLASLDAATLEALCEEFTAAVFKKAGVQRPPTPGA